MEQLNNSFQCALNSAVQGADYFDQRDMVVTVRNGSPLARAISALPSTLDRNQSAKISAEAFVNFLGANALAPNEGTGFSEFGARIIETAEAAAKAVTTELFQARTVVKPIIEELTKRMCEQAEMIGKNPITEFEIVRRSIPAPLKNASLIASIKRAEDVVTSTSRPNLRLPELSAQEILPLLRTGAGDLDKQVEELFASKPEGWLETTWKNIYTEKSAVGNDLQAVMFGRNNLHTALFVFLTARRLWDNPIENTNMSSNGYGDAMQAMRNQAAKILLSELLVLAEEEKNGVLVYSIRGNTIEVWEDAYRQWLSTGGKNEVLLGMAMTGNVKYTIAQINDAAAEFAGVWSRHEAINNASFMNTRLLRMRDALRLEMQHITTNSSEDEFPIAQRPSAMQCFNRMVNEVSYDDLKNLPMTCMRLVCRSRYPTYNFEAILESLQRQMDENPELTIKEAVDIVTKEHIARWLASQMVVVAPGAVQDQF